MEKEDLSADEKEYYKKLVKFRNSAANRFAMYTGVRITDIGPGWAMGEIKIELHNTNPIGSVHGGCIFTLADSVGGAAASSRKRPATTVNSGINYLNPAMADNTKMLYAKAKERKAGKSTCVYDIEVTDQDGRLIATSTATYFYLKGELKICEGSLPGLGTVP